MQQWREPSLPEQSVLSCTAPGWPSKSHRPMAKEDERSRTAAGRRSMFNGWEQSKRFV